ncbi:MAG: hypothetical protein GWN32_00880 [Gemmatimonadetes bacterium]|nr:hypothetical protein [Gemmatimonadota bacterium]
MNEENANELGPLYDADHSTSLEAQDRENPIPGGEPNCPVCGAKTVRLVESHHAPIADRSAFRVRLVCSNPDCRRWTVYDW